MGGVTYEAVAVYGEQMQVRSVAPEDADAGIGDTPIGGFRVGCPSGSLAKPHQVFAAFLPHAEASPPPCILPG